MGLRVVCISDTHMQHSALSLPECDLLIHAGDATLQGGLVEFMEFVCWYGAQLAKTKIFVAGNHDRGLEDDRAGIICSLFAEKGIVYLQDSGLEVGGLKIWGSPWSKRFGKWAFMGDSSELKHRWAAIPENVDILITHGPPFGLLDKNAEGEHCGCPALRQRLYSLDPALHVMGHIHEAYGRDVRAGKTLFVNAAICDLSYRPVNDPIVVDL